MDASVIGCLQRSSNYEKLRHLERRIINMNNKIDRSDKPTKVDA